MGKCSFTHDAWLQRLWWTRIEERACVSVAQSNEMDVALSAIYDPGGF